MGLDNGVCVRGVTRDELPKLIKYPFSDDYGGDVEIAYWRKCWDLRDMFLQEAYPNRDPQTYHFKMGLEEIKILIGVINYFFDNPKEWRRSIWEFNEYQPHLYRMRRNLIVLYYWVKWRRPDAEIYFYDSY